MEKCKVLMLCDTPDGVTGFAKVSYHIIKTLLETNEYSITVVGINDDGSLVRKQHGVRIIPATSALNPRYNDLYGRKRVLDELATGNYDIFWCLQDPGVCSTFMDKVVELQEKMPKERKFKTMLYYPVDSYLHTHRDWIFKGVSLFDYPTTYTKYAMERTLEIDSTLKNRLNYVYHGIDLNEFYPLDAASVKNFRKMGLTFKGKEVDISDRFVVLNVNRNQIRKDYVKTFATFKQLQKRIPNAFLFVLAQIQDQGGDLKDIAAHFGLEFGKDWMAPAEYTANTGFPVDMVNLIYNLSDVVFSSTVGEGFGLSSIEAMAVGKPCVFPNNTSLTEIFSGENGEDRGLLVPSGEDEDHLVSFGAMDSSLVRPTINTAIAADMLAYVHDNPEEVRIMTNRAREWVMGYTWNLVNRFWIERFAHVYAEVIRKRA